MTARKPLSKRLRFEIFKRDGFACQYCGAHPPAVILEVDHIVAVANGGDDDPDNLITSCFDCNRGKAAIGLDVIPQSLADKAAETAEREEQLLGYNQILQAKRDRVESDCWRVIDQLFGVEETTKTRFQSVKMFVEKLGVHDCLDAAEIAYGRVPYSEHARFKYFCGVCWNKLRERGGDG